MKSSSRLFYGITVFMAIVAVVYILATAYVKDTGSLQGLEWAGSVGLVLAAGLTAMLGGYLHITERHSDITPNDWEEAEIVDGAGELGFFSPSSIWPFVMTLSIAVLGYGIVFMAYWMIVMGAVMLIWSATMLNLQYGIPPEKH